MKEAHVSRRHIGAGSALSLFTLHLLHAGLANRR